MALSSCPLAANSRVILTIHFGSTFAALAVLTDFLSRQRHY
jgi:hypothetical protein